MGSITGIKYELELDKLPFFNKKTAEVLIGKSGKNLDKKISRLIKKGDLVRLKKGSYVSDRFLLSVTNRKAYTEYLANVLYFPSFLSLEYVLSLYNLIPEEINIFTSISLKSTRIFVNELGTFSYRNVKQELYCGYSKIPRDGFDVYIASKAKALFDFLYLKRNLSTDYDYEIGEGLRINWDEFSPEDLKEYTFYTDLFGSIKMKKILKSIRKIKNVNR